MAVPRRTSLRYRARFDETTPWGSLRTSSHLRWMQDVAWYHSASAGFDMAWYAQSSRFWLVRSVELDVFRRIEHADVVDVSTEVVGFRRIWARRVSEFRRAGGGDPFGRRRQVPEEDAGAAPEDSHRGGPGPDPVGRGTDDDVAATATIDWVMTDRSGRPVRVPDALLAAFAVSEQPFHPIRLELPDPPPQAHVTVARVLGRELDAFGHVNNAAYLDRFEEAVEDAGGGDLVAVLPRRYALEYVLPAGPGMRIVTTAWQRERGWAVQMTDEAGGTLFRGTVDPRPA